MCVALPKSSIAESVGVAVNLSFRITIFLKTMPGTLIVFPLYGVGNPRDYVSEQVHSLVNR